MTGNQGSVWKLLFLNLISHFNLIFSLTSNSMLWTATFGAVAMPFIFGVVGSLRFIYLPICFPAVPVYIEVKGRDIENLGAKIFVSFAKIF